MKPQGPKKEKSPIPAARSEFMGRAFACAHDELNRAMRYFLRDMSRAEQACHVEVSAQRESLGISAGYHETPDVERYSLAAQIFAAMTIEAGISYYTVLRFGGEPHDDHFRFPPVEKRLKKAFLHADIAHSSEIELFQILERRSSARDAIVHPFSAEYDEPLGTQRIPSRPWPDGSAAAARAAAVDVDRFFLLLRECDPSTSMLLHVF